MRTAIRIIAIFLSTGVLASSVQMPRSAAETVTDNGQVAKAADSISAQPAVLHTYERQPYGWQPYAGPSRRWQPGSRTGAFDRGYRSRAYSTWRYGGSHYGRSFERRWDQPYRYGSTGTRYGRQQSWAGRSGRYDGSPDRPDRWRAYEHSSGQRWVRAPHYGRDLYR